MTKEFKLTKAEIAKLKKGGVTQAEIDEWIKDPENVKWMMEQRVAKTLMKKAKSSGIHVKF